MPLVSVVIPTLREPDIGSVCEQVLAELASRGFEGEVLIVDDSDERSRQSIRDHIAARHDASRVTLIEGHRRGKGDAVRLGVLATHGDVVVTMDADLPVPLSYLEPFVREILEGRAGVVIAERPASRHAGRPVRAVVSNALRLLQRGVVFQSSRFADTQCGFKAFDGALAREMASRQVVEGGMVDVEYLAIALAHGAHIESVAVPAPLERPDTRINVLRCVVLDPIDLLRIKRRVLAGAYR